MLNNLKCPIDDNNVFEKHIIIYNVTINFYCTSCIKNKLLVCSLCGLFKIKGDRITHDKDPFIDKHPYSIHNFIQVDDHVLKAYLFKDSKTNFNYDKYKIYIEI
jgi:hypothetical protein